MFIPVCIYIHIGRNEHRITKDNMYQWHTKRIVNAKEEQYNK